MLGLLLCPLLFVSESYKFVRYYIYDYRTNICANLDIVRRLSVIRRLSVLFHCLCIDAHAHVTLGLGLSRLCPGLSRHV